MTGLKIAETTAKFKAACRELRPVKFKKNQILAGMLNRDIGKVPLRDHLYFSFLLRAFAVNDNGTWNRTSAPYMQDRWLGMPAPLICRLAGLSDDQRKRAQKDMVDAGIIEMCHIPHQNEDGTFVSQTYIQLRVSMLLSKLEDADRYIEVASAEAVQTQQTETDNAGEDLQRRSAPCTSSLEAMSDSHVGGSEVQPIDPAILHKARSLKKNTETVGSLFKTLLLSQEEKEITDILKQANIFPAKEFTWKNLLQIKRLARFVSPDIRLTLDRVKTYVAAREGLFELTETSINPVELTGNLETVLKHWPRICRVLVKAGLQRQVTNAAFYLKSASDIEADVESHLRSLDTRWLNCSLGGMSVDRFVSTWHVDSSDAFWLAVWVLRRGFDTGAITEDLQHDAWSYLVDNPLYGMWAKSQSLLPTDSDLVFNFDTTARRDFDKAFWLKQEGIRVGIWEECSAL